MRTGILIQARLSSTRLPGKVMFKLGNTKFNSLDLIHQRISKKEINDFAKIIFITSNNICDDAINNYCKEQKYLVFRGEEEDVLSRYYEAARRFNLEQIIRLTSDCPFIDYEEILRVYKIHIYKNNDFTTNSFEGSSIVDGCDVEIFNFSSLEKAFYCAKNKIDREHVTSYFYSQNGFKYSFEDPNMKYPYTRLTLDTPQDFFVISQLLNLISDPINSKISEFASLYYENNLSKYNNFIKRNSGWSK